MNYTIFIRTLLISIVLNCIPNTQIHAMVPRSSTQQTKASTYETFRKRTAYIKAYSRFKESQKYDFASNTIQDPQELKRQAIKNKEIDTIVSSIATLLEGLEELLALFGTNNTLNRDAFLHSLTTLNFDELLAARSSHDRGTAISDATMLEQVKQKTAFRNKALAQNITKHIGCTWNTKLVEKLAQSYHEAHLIQCIEDAYNASSDKQTIAALIQKSLLDDVYKRYTTTIIAVIETMPKAPIRASQTNVSEQDKQELHDCGQQFPDADKKKIQQIVDLLKIKAPTDLTTIKQLIKAKSFREAFTAVNSLKPTLLNSSNQQAYAEVEDLLKKLPEDMRKKLPFGYEWLYKYDHSSSSFAQLVTMLNEIILVCDDILEHALKHLLEEFIANNSLEKTPVANRLAHELSTKLETHVPQCQQSIQAHMALQKVAHAFTACYNYDKAAIARYSISDQPLLFYEDDIDAISSRTIKELVLENERSPSYFLPAFICHLLQTAEIKDDPQDVFNFLISRLDYYPSVHTDALTGQPVYCFIKSSKISPKNKLILSYLRTLLDKYNHVINRKLLEGKWELNLEHITQLEQPTKLSGIHAFSPDTAQSNEKSWNFKNSDGSITTVTLMLDKDSLLYCPTNPDVSIGTLRHVSTSTSRQTMPSAATTTNYEPKCSTLFPPDFAREDVMLPAITQALHTIKVRQIAINTRANERVLKVVGACKTNNNKIFIEFIIDNSDTRVVPSIVTFYPLATFKQAHPVLITDLAEFTAQTRPLGKTNVQTLAQSNPAALARVALSFMTPQEIRYQATLKATICNDIARQIIASSQQAEALVTPAHVQHISPLTHKDLLVLILGTDAQEIDLIARNFEAHKTDKATLKAQLTQVITEKQAAPDRWVNDVLALGNRKHWSAEQLKNSVLYCYKAFTDVNTLTYLVNTKKIFKDKTNVLVVVCNFQTGTGNSLRISDKLKLLPNGNRYYLNKLGASFFYIPIKKHEIEYYIQEQLLRNTSNSNSADTQNNSR